MKFFISNKEKLTNKHGQWYWWADKKCNVTQNEEHLVIYSGYVIEEPIDEIVFRDPHLLENSNGTFWAVILTKTSVKVIVDYFCQSKIFYRQTDRIEITNAMYLFPFNSKDIDMPEVMNRLNIPEKERNYKVLTTFERWETFILDWASYTDSGPNLGIRQYSPSKCKTIFKNTFILEPDHCLEVVDNILNIKRIHNTHKSIMDALSPTIPAFNTSAEIEEYIHFCMDSHASVIKQNYKNITSSLSEGIDSVLQDQYFPESKKIMYHFAPSNGPFDYKQKANNKTKNKNVQVGHFPLDKDSISKIAGEVMNDPSCFYWDTLPTQWQLANMKNKPDVLLFGQNGDNMFMHKPFFYYEYMFVKQIPKKISVQQKLEEFNKALDDFKDCYSSRDNLWGQPIKTWQETFPDQTKEELIKELETDSEDAWKEDFARKNTPGLYNREISHAGDTLVTSLYCDKRIFYKVMSMPENIMLESIKEAQIQKNILKSKFNYTFETPYKDQAEFNAVHIIKPMYMNGMKHCLKNHLPDA